MIGISGTLSKAWMAEALGVRFDRDYYFNPAKRHEVDCRCNEYAAERFGGMRLFYSESNLGRMDYWDESQVLIGGIQPNMILGMLLGAEFVAGDDKDADITPHCLTGKDIGDLPEPESLLDHQLIKLFLEIDKPLNAATELTWGISDQKEQKTIRRGIAEITSRIYTDLMLPIIRQYPELDPEKISRREQ